MTPIGSAVAHLVSALFAKLVQVLDVVKMRHCIVACMVLPLLALVTLGAADPMTGRVVGGETAGTGQYPFIVSLRRNGAHTCGGSIITRNFVLTAGHCVGAFDSNGKYFYYPVREYSIRAGSNDRFIGGVLVGIAEFITHENYLNFRNDVSLLRLQKSFIFSSSVQPIALASSNTPDNVDVVISGWGRLKHQGDLPRYLQHTTLKSISIAECDDRIGWGVESELCLMHGAAHGTCNGDSGGPAIYKGEVVGIASFVWSGCAFEYPDGYARVYSFRDWIKQNSDL